MTRDYIARSEAEMRARELRSRPRLQLAGE
jgi:hypothetical protein